MTGPARVVLVRHAVPADDGLVLPMPDVELGVRGREQAQLLAERLAPSRPAALYSSPRPRAVQTAQPLADVLVIEPVIVPDLREIDFGLLDGLPLEEVARRYPELGDWTTTPSTTAFPEGESVQSLSNRTVSAAREIASAHPGETAVVVCHGVVIRTIVAHALGMPLDSIFRLEVPYCGASVIDWFGERPLVRSINGSL